MSKDISRDELLKKITALDFMIIDLQLYLNTHPTDNKALASHNSFVIQANTFKQNYEKMFGMLSATESCSSSPWQWIQEPWPWEYEANFKLGGEER